MSKVSRPEDFDSMKVPDLKSYLMKRGITCSFYRKDALTRLCKTAYELELEVIATPDDYQNMDTQRRTVIFNDIPVILPSVVEIPDSDLKKDLKQ